MCCSILVPPDVLQCKVSSINSDVVTVVKMYLCRRFITDLPPLFGYDGDPAVSVVTYPRVVVTRERDGELVGTVPRRSEDTETDEETEPEYQKRSEHINHPATIPSIHSIAPIA